MTTQSRFWQEFSDLKGKAIYISHYHAAVEKTDRAINIFSAMASSGSIAAWAVWHSAALVWAVVIAASQVVTAIKPFLPYRARLKALSGLGTELDVLVISAENDWFKVSEGLLPDAEIHKLTMSLKRKIQLDPSRLAADHVLPTFNLKVPMPPVKPPQTVAAPSAPTKPTK